MTVKGARRITIETLAAGQPAAYKDTRLHVRVTFEHVPYTSLDLEFVEHNVPEEYVRKVLLGLNCGFTEKVRKDPDCNWWDTRLDWLRPVETDPGNPKETLAYVWEFHTTTPYTD